MKYYNRKKWEKIEREMANCSREDKLRESIRYDFKMALVIAVVYIVYVIICLVIKSS
jgi:hypothetical protein